MKETLQAIIIIFVCVCVCGTGSRRPMYTFTLLCTHLDTSIFKRIPIFIDRK